MMQIVSDKLRLNSAGLPPINRPVTLAQLHGLKDHQQFHLVVKGMTLAALRTNQKAKFDPHASELCAFCTQVFALFSHSPLA